MRPARTGELVQRLVSSANIEIIPLKGIEEKFGLLPAGTRVTITCSAKFGVERTLEYAELARAAGLEVVPHLAARQVRNFAELSGIVNRLATAGITDLYVIGGDADTPTGDYASSLELLSDLNRLDHGFDSIGVACYPEGHPQIPDDVLLNELKGKQELAHYMVSQLCFDVDALISWLDTIRSAGITMPLRLGVAGPVHTRKLAELSMRIGVGASLRYLTKQHGLVRNLLVGSSYQPEGLVQEIADHASFADLGVEGLHVFSFNQVDATADWLHRIADPEGFQP